MVSLEYQKILGLGLGLSTTNKIEKTSPQIREYKLVVCVKLIRHILDYVHNYHYRFDKALPPSN